MTVDVDSERLDDTTSDAFVVVSPLSVNPPPHTSRNSRMKSACAPFTASRAFFRFPIVTRRVATTGAHVVVFRALFAAFVRTISSHPTPCDAATHMTRCIATSLVRTARFASVASSASLARRLVDAASKTTHLGVDASSTRTACTRTSTDALAPTRRARTTRSRRKPVVVSRAIATRLARRRRPVRSLSTLESMMTHFPHRLVFARSRARTAPDARRRRARNFFSSRLPPRLDRRVSHSRDSVDTFETAIRLNRVSRTHERVRDARGDASSTPTTRDRDEENIVRRDRRRSRAMDATPTRARGVIRLCVREISFHHSVRSRHCA
jgi:hypothetical protein